MPGVQPKDEGYANCIHPAEALRAWRIGGDCGQGAGIDFFILVCLETVAS